MEAARQRRTVTYRDDGLGVDGVLRYLRWVGTMVISHFGGLSSIRQRLTGSNQISLMDSIIIHFPHFAFDIIYYRPFRALRYF